MVVLGFLPSSTVPSVLNLYVLKIITNFASRSCAPSTSGWKNWGIIVGLNIGTSINMFELQNMSASIHTTSPSLRVCVNLKK
jgi:hypothetical protein